jgi:hypothetical protein
MATFLSFGTGSACALLLAASAVAQDTVCAASLVAPLYPDLARAERITGAVDVRFQVSSDGQARDFACKGTPVLCASARAAVEKTRFARDCANSSVVLAIRFELEGEPAADPVTTVTFRTPNAYLITSNPAPRPAPKRNTS